MATGQTPTLEQYLGIDENKFPRDFPLPDDVRMEPPTPDAGSEMPITDGLPGKTEPGAGVVTVGDTETAPSPEAGTGRTARHGGIADPGAGGAQTVGQPTAAAPTPPSTDYSQLNDILTQLLKSQQANAGGNADFKNNLRTTIMGLIKSGSAPVDANDPTIASATSAFRGEGERALALLREKQAEAARAGGRTAGSEESAVKSGYEDLGNATGSYAANLQIQELQARRQQLMEATRLGAGVMGAEEAQALQAQVAAIDGQLKELSLKSNEGLTREGLTNQNTQFYDNLSYLMGNQANGLDDLLSQYLMNAA